MSEPTEVRLVPVSEAQRDALASDEDRLAAIAVSEVVAAWDAAEPGVVDASWAEVCHLLASLPCIDAEAGVGWSGLPAAREALAIARAAAGEPCQACRGAERDADGRPCAACGGTSWVQPAGGERPSVSLRETIECRIAPPTIEEAQSAMRAAERSGHPRDLAVAEQNLREAEEGERDA
jgi:hypothetical protein